MKKILITIGLILICYLGYGQYPITQNLGGPTTLVKNPNYGGMQGGLIPFVFTDTSQANSLAPYLKNYDGAIIKTTTPINAMWYRYLAGTQWVQFIPGGGGTGTLSWNQGGNNPVVTDGSGYGLIGPQSANGLSAITNNVVRFSINTSGAFGLGSGRDFGTAGYVLSSNGSGAAPSWIPAGGGTTPISSLTAAAASNTISNANYTQQWGWALTGSQSALQLANTTSTASGNEKVLEISSSGAHASNNITTYGGYITNSHSGTGSINVALNARALNGDENIAAWFGRGKVRLGTTSFEKGILEILGNTSGTVTIQPAAAAGTWTMTLPTTDGNSGEYLQTDGNGVTSWAAVTAGANTALSNLASVAINTSLLPGTDNSIDLGSGSNQWRYGIFGTGGISIGAAAAPSIGRLQVETGGGANGGITLRNTTAGAYSTMDFYNNGGFNGQFLFTGSTYTNGFFNGNQLAFANYASGGNVGFVAGTASGYIKFGAGALTAAAEKMRINSTGVGIANSSPVALLTLGTAGTTLGSFSSAGNTSGVISFLPQAAAGTYNWNWPTTAGTIGYFLTSGGGGSTAMTWTDPATITGLNYWSTNSGTTLGADVTVTGSGSFNFNISTGATGISTDFGTGKTLLGDVNGAGSGTLITVDDGNLNIILHRSVQFDSYTAGAATFDGSGNITSVSDRRAKHSISPFTYGLNSILKLNPSSYIYNQDKSNTLMSGFIAQDVQKSIPIAVHENGAGMMSLETNAILAANVNAIKELYSMIVKQQTEIDNLKKEINKLKRN